VGQKLTFGVVVRPQHWPWADQISEWPKLEAMGFDSIWLNDHFHSLGETIDNPAFEASTTLAALALSTSRVRIGVLTYGNTHRNPAILAKQIVTVDQMSGGRVIFGIGAGWHESEHAAYGITLPSAGDRVRMLEETLELFRLLEQNDRTTFHGRYYTLEDAPFWPKPVNGRIPILIGGTKPKMLRLIGQYADIWDSSMAVDEYSAALGTIREHALEFGRDPEAIVASANVWEGPISDGEFADKVRAYYKAGARQMLLKYTPDRKGVETFPKLMQEIVPELKTELER
jgi:alkanesulfonate monooxygenase SsuD/methylene tetrahydromethanopterin reductase-like flavin-dependent oxidoreductase (luciferase family)